MRSQDTLHGTAGEDNPGLPSVVKCYGLGDVRQSIFKEEKTMADMWWARLSETWKRESKPVAEVTELLKVDQDEVLPKSWRC
uniref:RxLR effector candidate protein n=1 Tax=Hyaloperonospora arabidopsidis (strain Emoy2) TaxID=559515 RepID=M4C4A9_HYAAE